MSMSTRVEGVRPPDEKWLKMKQAWEACEAAGIKPPKDVLEFFNHEKPDADGVVVQLSGFSSNHECCTKIGAFGEEGFDIHIDKLPADIKIIRFRNSW